MLPLPRHPFGPVIRLCAMTSCGVKTEPLRLAPMAEANASSVVDVLERLALLRARPPHGPMDLLRLCHGGWLEGGLSVALDVRPDELWGPLTHALGGAARRLKVEDVRGHQSLELFVARGRTAMLWRLDGLEALVERLNDFFEADLQVRAAAVLGECDEMLQLWCIDKRHLRALLSESFFGPHNRAQLEAIAGKSRRP